MSAPIRVLHIEDVEEDAELLLRELRKGGYSPVARRVDTPELLRSALEESWDVVICDYSLPRMNALSALQMIHESGRDLPFIIVSGSVGEETAVAAMRAGAHDYLMKDRTARLVEVVRRELREAAIREERTRSDRAVRMSEERFRTLVGAIDDLVFTSDREQRFSGLFGAGWERAHLKADECVGKTVTEVLGAEIGALHALATARALDGESATYEWSRTGAEGIRWFQTVLSAMRDIKGQTGGLVGIARETTEQKRMGAQLREADRMATMGMLAAGVAHEINNPMAYVIGNIGFASKQVEGLLKSVAGVDAGDLKEQLSDVRASLAEIEDGTERVRLIVRDLKAFTKTEEERRGPVELASVMQASLAMAAAEVRHRATVVKEFEACPPAFGNESRLGQVFLNLIINAAQAMPDRPIQENQIVLRVRGKDRHVIAEVADNGAGIPPELLARIFEPLFTTKPVGVGTGLGLAICKDIVKDLGGELTVESHVRVGTTFRVRLPADEGAEAGKVVAAPVASARRGRVLVVDDEAMLRAAIQRALKADHEVVGMGGGAEALALLADGQRFDAILSDLTMPGMSGIDLHSRLAAMVPEQAERMIFMTGGIVTREANEFVRRITNPVIDKPFDFEQLKLTIGQLVDRGPAAPAKRSA